VCYLGSFWGCLRIMSKTCDSGRGIAHFVSVKRNLKLATLLDTKKMLYTYMVPKGPAHAVAQNTPVTSWALWLV